MESSLMNGYRKSSYSSLYSDSYRTNNNDYNIQRNRRNNSDRFTYQEGADFEAGQQNTQLNASHDCDSVKEEVVSDDNEDDINIDSDDYDVEMEYPEVINNELPPVIHIFAVDPELDLDDEIDDYDNNSQDYCISNESCTESDEISDGVYIVDDKVVKNHSKQESKDDVDIIDKATVIKENNHNLKNCFKTKHKSTSLPHSPIHESTVYDDRSSLSFDVSNLQSLKDFGFTLESLGESINDGEIKMLNDDDVNSFIIHNVKKDQVKKEPLEIKPLKFLIKGEAQVSDDHHESDMEIDNLVSATILDTKNTTAPKDNTDDSIKVHTGSDILNGGDFDIATTKKGMVLDFCIEKKPKPLLNDTNEDDYIDVETLADVITVPVIEAQNLDSLLEQFEETERVNKDVPVKKAVIPTDSISTVVHNQAVANLEDNDIQQFVNENDIVTLNDKTSVKGFSLLNGSRQQEAVAQLNRNKLKHIMMSPSAQRSNSQDSSIHSDHDYCSPSAQQQNEPVKTRKFYKKRQSLLKPDVILDNKMKKSLPRNCKSNVSYISSSDDDYSNLASKKDKNKDIQTVNIISKVNPKSLLRESNVNISNEKVNSIEKQKSLKITISKPQALICDTQVDSKQNINKNDKTIINQYTLDLSRVNENPVNTALSIEEKTLATNHIVPISHVEVTVKSEPDVKQVTKKKLNLQEYKKRREASSNASSRTVSPEIPAELRKDAKINNLTFENMLKDYMSVKVETTNTTSKVNKPIFDPITEASRKILAKKSKMEAMRKKAEDKIKIPKVDNLEIKPLLTDEQMLKLVGFPVNTAVIAPSEKQTRKNVEYEEIVMLSIGVNTENVVISKDETKKKSVNTNKDKIQFKIKTVNSKIGKSNVFDNKNLKKAPSPLKNENEEIDEARFKNITQTIKNVEKINEKMSQNSLFASIQNVILQKSSPKECSKSPETEIPMTLRENKKILIVNETPNTDHGEDKIILHLDKQRVRVESKTISTQTEKLKEFQDLELMPKTHTEIDSKNEHNKKKIEKRDRRSNDSGISMSTDGKSIKKSQVVNKRPRSRDASRSRPHKRTFTPERTTKRNSRSLNRSSHRSRRRSYSKDRSYRRRSRSYRRKDTRSTSRKRYSRRSYSRDCSRSHRKSRARSSSHRRHRSRSTRRKTYRSRSRQRTKDHSKERSRSRSFKQSVVNSKEEGKIVNSPKDLKQSTDECDVMLVLRTPASSRKSTTSESSVSSERSSECESGTSVYSSSSGEYCKLTRPSSYFYALPTKSVASVEERKIVFVGKLTADDTKISLKSIFQEFGPISEVRIHTKEAGSRYGFVTFRNPRDAWNVVESASSPSLSRFLVGFGGRRAFCGQNYADLDGIEAEYSEFYSAPSTAMNDDSPSFDHLLEEMRRLQKLKRVDSSQPVDGKPPDV